MKIILILGFLLLSIQSYANSNKACYDNFGDKVECADACYKSLTSPNIYHDKSSCFISCDSNNNWRSCFNISNHLVKKLAELEDGDTKIRTETAALYYLKKSCKNSWYFLSESCSIYRDYGRRKNYLGFLSIYYRFYGPIKSYIDIFNFVEDKSLEKDAWLLR